MVPGLEQGRAGDGTVVPCLGEGLPAAWFEADGKLSPLVRLLLSMRSQLDQRLALVGSDTRRPLIVGITGSVAAGKTTFARMLGTALAVHLGGSDVEAVSVDGFLYPLQVLEERDLLWRKGFPETYDFRPAVKLIAELCRGAEQVSAPIYRHQTYDIDPVNVQVIRRPAVLLVEGLHLLSTEVRTGGPLVSDFLDISIYLDAEEATLKRWYLERFFALMQLPSGESAYFDRYRGLPREELEALAIRIWETINLVNLRQHILPVRERASVVIRKAGNHDVERVVMRWI